MSLFFVNPKNINTKERTAALEGLEWEHASKVLRFRVGDELEFFDGQGNVYRSIIATSKAQSFSLKITQTNFYTKDYSLSVFVGLPKGPKIDLIVKALTEAGATNIGLFTSKYSVTRAKSLPKIERLKKIVIEACKQSQRAWLPSLGFIGFTKLIEIVDKAPNVIVFYENASDYPALSSLKPKELVLVIGPEGGFSQDEVGGLKARGAVVSRLSDAILRVETAAITATGLARYVQLGST